MKERIKVLREEIKRANYAYYELGEPIMEDYVYDSLYRELEELEKVYSSSIDSPTQEIGVRSSSNKIKHHTPLYSLENAFSIDEFKRWDKGKEYIGELKVDGVAISLTYRNGVLDRACTRGDGLEGEDVTDNIKSLVPLVIPNLVEVLEIRGEAYIPLSKFRSMSSEFSNPRNLVAGTLRHINSRVIQERGVEFYAFSVIQALDIGLTRQFEVLNWLEQVGFSVNNNLLICSTIEEVDTFYRYWSKERETLDYQIDGVVIKINDIRLHNGIGFTNKYPKWAIALKFQGEKATTIVEEIHYQVGRSGVLTPVGILKPIEVSNSLISRVTLHNDKFIKEKDIRVGDTIVIHKSGDVIPEVVEVLYSFRSKDSLQLREPNECPECSSRTIYDGDYKCINPSCKGILKASLLHWCSRDCMDIRGLGESIINQLVDSNIVKSVSHLYKLKDYHLLVLDKVGIKRANSILQSIETSKSKPLNKVLYSLNIPLMGNTTSRLVVSKYPSIESLMVASISNLQDIEGIGEGIATSLYNWLQNNKATIDELREDGLLRVESKVSPSKGLDKEKRLVLESKTFVLTGTLSITREEAINLININGGRVVNSISSKVDYLLIGNNPGSKYKKAMDLNIDIIDESSFLNIVKV
jgi:DNA ligase (NAD+)